MTDGFVTTKDELFRVIAELCRCHREHDIKESARHAGYFFWNAVSNENAPEWPTIYFSKRLVHECRIDAEAWNGR